MPTESINLPEDLADRIDRLASETARSTDSLIVEALELYLDELEDLDLALARWRDPMAVWVDHDRVLG